MKSGIPSRKAVILGPGEGRSYLMGRIAAVFKADESESESRYSISEWWLEPHTQGPGPHSHPEDDIFYVIEGTMSVLVGEAWTHATRGSFILVPGGVTHDFENRGETRAGVLNLSIPGRSSRTYLPSRSGLPKIHPKMQASNQAIELTAARGVLTLKTTKSLSLRVRRLLTSVVHLVLIRSSRLPDGQRITAC